MFHQRLIFAYDFPIVSLAESPPSSQIDVVGNKLRGSIRQQRHDARRVATTYILDNIRATEAGTRSFATVDAIIRPVADSCIGRFVGTEEYVPLPGVKVPSSQIMPIRVLCQENLAAHHCEGSAVSHIRKPGLRLAIKHPVQIRGWDRIRD